MRIQVYVLNKTYIAEDLSTGLVAYGDSAQAAEKELQALVAEYWEKKKVIVPINQDVNDAEPTKGETKPVL